MSTRDSEPTPTPAAPPLGSRSEPPTPEERLARAREVIDIETRAVAQLTETLDSRFLEACDRVLSCTGSVVVTGMGKAGLIGQKISATMASTGTPSIFLHPAEALHGDLGRIRRDDVLLALSNSGESDEIKRCIPPAKKIGATVIGMTGRTESTLARLSDCVLDIGRPDEACPLGLAPTATTSAMLALGDALAMVVAGERQFSREEYALFHPAGSLGRRLMKVGEVMRRDQELPLVPAGTPVHEVLLRTTGTPGRPGAALVVDAAGALVGIFTDGDLRRLLERDGAARLHEPVDEFMGREPSTVGPDELLEAAAHLLHERRIDQIPVIDDSGKPVGLLDVQDILDVRV